MDDNSQQSLYTIKTNENSGKEVRMYNKEYKEKRYQSGKVKSFIKKYDVNDDDDGIVCSAAGICFKYNKEMLLLHKINNNRYQTTLLGGKRENINESNFDVAAREFCEETIPIINDDESKEHHYIEQKSRLIDATLSYPVEKIWLQESKYFVFLIHVDNYIINSVFSTDGLAAWTKIPSSASFPGNYHPTLQSLITIIEERDNNEI